MIYQVKGISGHQWVCVGCAQVCAGVRECVHGCARVCAGVGGSAWVCVGVHGCAQVCVDMHGCVWICACVWDEFSEFLLENKVPTSADFNTYPIRIFRN